MHFQPPLPTQQMGHLLSRDAALASSSFQADCSCTQRLPTLLELGQSPQQAAGLFAEIQLSLSEWLARHLPYALRHQALLCFHRQTPG